MHGILLIDKPEGITSAEVVRRVKRRLRTKTGHLGTLDPFASGLLPICLGEGTKIATFLNQDDKAYTGLIRLGRRTDTADRTGAVVAEAAVPASLADPALTDLAASLLGERDQVPPMYSALKQGGRPLYALARQGISVERAPRRITLYRLELRAVGGDAIAFDLGCSKGTYVRVLAEEIAAALGTVGHLETLRRTQFGHLHIDEAVTLADWEQGAEAMVLPPAAALSGVAEVQLDDEQEGRARQGAVGLLARLRLPRDEATVKLVAHDGSLVAVVSRMKDGGWGYARVFASM